MSGIYALATLKTSGLHIVQERPGLSALTLDVGMQLSLCA